MLKKKFRVTFKFKDCQKSNNGTDTESGQIPSILYCLLSEQSLENSHSHQVNVHYKVHPLHKRLFQDFSKVYVEHFLNCLCNDI